MTEDKLTFRDALLYPKATITSVPLIHMFSDVKVLIEYAHENMLTIQEIIDFNNLKLILRDISQLTDEEKQYIIDKNFMHNIEVLFEYDINEIIRNTYSNKTIKLIDYFREIGIDIDGMFASGKAVKE